MSLFILFEMSVTICCLSWQRFFVRNGYFKCVSVLVWRLEHIVLLLCSSRRYTISSASGEKHTLFLSHFVDRCNACRSGTVMGTRKRRRRRRREGSSFAAWKGAARRRSSLAFAVWAGFFNWFLPFRFRWFRIRLYRRACLNMGMCVCGRWLKRS